MSENSSIDLSRVPILTGFSVRVRRTAWMMMRKFIATWSTSQVAQSRSITSMSSPVCCSTRRATQRCQVEEESSDVEGTTLWCIVAEEKSDVPGGPSSSRMGRASRRAPARDLLGRTRAKSVHIPSLASSPPSRRPSTSHMDRMARRRRVHQGRHSRAGFRFAEVQWWVAGKRKGSTRSAIAHGGMDEGSGLRRHSPGSRMS